ncbi:EamA family transporter RarD [Nodosilinea sp. LEGE 07298]|uniref:EamA family transporter RarD n=1 Tax=Nodosilinea sp. LEGE 07298 TaxID=2777970 RepID=UPI00187FC34A|nr:EamA family transporter RarD [Nodosilinea sp. LEGE 07298]MBE9110127.1 EamA family transporter RarD [Nodosilinea sp. LEGE 07298]
MTLPKSAAPGGSSEANLGPIYALLAYSTWGLLPIYWKFFGTTSAIEVLSHRMIWSAVFLVGILVVQRRLPDLLALLRGAKPDSEGSSFHPVLVLLLTASLLSFNWGLYIYGVNSDRVVEASLGYYINPLVTVLLGFVFLKERLHRGQQVAVALAVVGVGYFIWQLGTVPWIALALAVSFAFYGLLRKVVAVAPLIGLAVETLLITPITLLFVSWLGITGQGHFGESWSMTLLFIGAGVTTSMPLLWFNNAAKRLKLATLGFFQYLAPSLSLLLGVFVYGEPFTPVHVVTFGCIWAALLLYSVTALRARPRPI